MLTCEDENARRSAKALGERVRRARFEEVTTLDRVRVWNSLTFGPSEVTDTRSVRPGRE